MTTSTHLRTKPPRTRPAAAVALILLLGTAGAGCVREPEAQTCPSGIYCPAGARCAARQAVCIFDACGDGVLQAGEVCDDGNVEDRDRCSHDCTSDESCGNRITDLAVGEVCDDGNTLPGDGCAADCKSFERCGDGKVDPGEECDTTVETRGCDGDCTYAVHGDGKVNVLFGEFCDGDGSGAAAVGPECQSPTCNQNCTVSAHGDGWANPQHGEECDGDGRGHAAGPGCQSPTCNETCTRSRHGDGWVNPQDGEACDGDGAGGSNGVDCQWQGCNANCSVSRHGDGWVNPPDGEECDGNGRGTGNGVDCRSATCNADCTPSRCGDGIVNGQAGEACDDGNDSNLDDCRNDCKANVCGDGLVNRDGPLSTEACDLGARNGIAVCDYGLVSCEACSRDCRVVVPSVSYCGNDRVDGPIGEEKCDDARSAACGTCVDCGIVAVASATGSVTVVSTAVADGDSMVVDDGDTPPVTFEFSQDGTCAMAGSVCVSLAGAAGATTDGIAAAIRSAFARAAPLGVRPEATTAGPNPIDLRNVKEGVGGNVPIEVQGALPATGAIEVSGMQGGRGCALGAPCFDAKDCVSGKCGATSKVCRAP